MQLYIKETKLENLQNDFLKKRQWIDYNMSQSPYMRKGTSNL